MDCIKLLVEHTKIHPKDMIFDTSVDFFLQILKDSTNIDEELEVVTTFSYIHSCRFHQDCLKRCY